MTPFRIVAAMIAVVAAVIALTAYTWVQMGDTAGATTGISWHGIIAMVLGVGFSLALGVGLMTLVFYSSRSGHDDDVGRHDP